MAGKIKDICVRDYLAYSTYLEFLIGRARNGGVWSSVKRTYKKIKRYTLISAILKALIAVVALLEKSAVLLLAFTVAVIALPISAFCFIAAEVIGGIKYGKIRGEIDEWLGKSEEISVYITSDRFYVKGEDKARTAEECVRVHEGKKLFARMAIEEASKYEHPVIVVCSDPFLAVEWAGYNILTVKNSCFYKLRGQYFEGKRVTCTVLS